MALPLLVGTRFQVLLTPLAGVLFTFPSRYWFTIGRRRVFSLTTWSSWIPAGFHVSRGTQLPATSRTTFTYGAVTPSGRPFQPILFADRSITRRAHRPDRFGTPLTRPPLQPAGPPTPEFDKSNS